MDTHFQSNKTLQINELLPRFNEIHVRMIAKNRQNFSVKLPKIRKSITLILNLIKSMSYQSVITYSYDDNVQLASK